MKSMYSTRNSTQDNKKVKSEPACTTYDAGTNNHEFKHNFAYCTELVRMIKIYQFRRPEARA